MPTVKENTAAFNREYNWDGEGEEWSLPWGGTSMEWYGSILPRIHPFLPVHTILEIAPGFGRWTQFLKDYCENLIVVDLSEKCITACRERFSNTSHITYFTNDGKSLDMISDKTIDFAFSFDSLVHVDDNTMSAYVSELSRKLKPNGVAFIHHSNFGEYNFYGKVASKIEKFKSISKMLKKIGLLDEVKEQWRSSRMTAKRMQLYAGENGLNCISQELITWGTNRVLLDCISTLVKEDSMGAKSNNKLKNHSFMKEAQYLSRLSQLYSIPGSKK